MMAPTSDVSAANVETHELLHHSLGPNLNEGRLQTLYSLH